MTGFTRVHRLGTVQAGLACGVCHNDRYAKAELGKNTVRVVQGGADGGSMAGNLGAEKCENDHRWTESCARCLQLCPQCCTIFKYQVFLNTWSELIST